ncbi:MAG: rRNA maturation RNase YbeY [Synechococcus sp.]
MTSQQSASPPLDLYVNAEVAAPVSQEEWLRWFESWLDAMQVSGPSELTLTLTDDERMQGLNRQYRDRDTTTDVLAFAAQEAEIPGNSREHSRVLGDIVISVPTAQRQADEQQHSLAEELAWLSSHGLLHLLGWDHPDEEHLQQMLQQQQDLLNYTRE